MQQSNGIGVSGRAPKKQTQKTHHHTVISIHKLLLRALCVQRLFRLIAFGALSFGHALALNRCIYSLVKRNDRLRVATLCKAALTIEKVDCSAVICALFFSLSFGLSVCIAFGLFVDLQ